MNAKKKGYRVEYQLMKTLQKAGFEARRVPLSGSTRGYKGDIVLTLGNEEIVLEVKGREVFSKLYTYNIPFLYRNDIAVVPLFDVLKGGGKIKYHKYAVLPPATLKTALKQARREQALLVVKSNRKPFLLVARKKDVEYMRELAERGKSTC